MRIIPKLQAHIEAALADPSLPPLPQRVRPAYLDCDFCAELMALEGSLCVEHNPDTVPDDLDLDAPVPYVPVPTGVDSASHVTSSVAGVAALRFSHPAPARVFGFNVITIDPDGNHGGPRLDGVVSRQRAEDELDELAPFMVDGYTTVLVELREVSR